MWTKPKVDTGNSTYSIGWKRRGHTVEFYMVIPRGKRLVKLAVEEKAERKAYYNKRSLEEPKDYIASTVALALPPNRVGIAGMSITVSALEKGGVCLLTQSMVNFLFALYPSNCLGSRGPVYPRVS